MLRTILIAGLAVAGVSACQQRTLPPGDPNVCYHAVPQPDGEVKFNRLSVEPSLEACAAALESMRLRFLRMGGSNREIMGAYQGNFIFVEPRGIFTAPSLEQNRYLALVRSGDGRLVTPGAMPMPQD